MTDGDKPNYDSDFVRLVQNALAKKRAGHKLKRDELRAIERYQRDEDERARRRHYAEIPKKLWVQWSGRQHKVLNDQAAAHGLPVSGETIDLAAVVKWLHEFLAANQYKLLRDDAAEDDGTEAGERLKNLRLKNELIEIDLAAARGETMPRTQVHDGLAAIAARLRAAGDQLQRRFGAEGLSIMHEALDDADRIVSRLFGTEEQDTSEPPAAGE